MKCIVLTLMLIVTGSIAAAECPAPGSVVELFGTIGKGLGISMVLTGQSDRVTGSYEYVKYEKKIPLTGTCNSGSLRLQELNASGKPTASFRGSFTKPQIVEGSWSTLDGKKTLPFHLQALLPSDHVSGRYETPGIVCTTDDDKSVDEPPDSLNILLMEDGNLRIQGNAFYVNVLCNLHTGDADGTAKLEGDKAHYVFDANDPTSCRFTIHLAKGSIEVTDESGTCGGANVEFSGTYTRVGPPVFDESSN